MLFDGSDPDIFGTMNVTGYSSRDGRTRRDEWHRDGSAAHDELQAHDE